MLCEESSSLQGWSTYQMCQSNAGLYECGVIVELVVLLFRSIDFACVFFDHFLFVFELLTNACRSVITFRLQAHFALAFRIFFLFISIQKS